MTTPTTTVSCADGCPPIRLRLLPPVVPAGSGALAVDTRLLERHLRVHHRAVHREDEG